MKKARRLGAGATQANSLVADRTERKAQGKATDGHNGAGASERLHKVPSTISYAVGKLEEQLGLALFTRNGPRVALTPAGHELLKEGRWLIADEGRVVQIDVTEKKRLKPN